MIEIIPAIDIVDGKCVRLEQGDFDRSTTYSDDPVEIACAFESAGLMRLHLVDLDGAKLRQVRNLSVLKAIAKTTNLIIDFGGGIASLEHLESVYDAGAALASIGSVAVRSPSTFEAWVTRYGPDKFLLGADVRGDKLAIDGWSTQTDINIADFLIGHSSRGLVNIFVTDIGRDGLLAGPSLELYRSILASVPNIDLIASGGVRSLEDVLELEKIGCRGVIVGKAIYEGLIGLEELADLIGEPTKNARKTHNPVSRH